MWVSYSILHQVLQQCRTIFGAKLRLIHVCSFLIISTTRINKFSLLPMNCVGIVMHKVDDPDHVASEHRFRDTLLQLWQRRPIVLEVMSFFRIFVNRYCWGSESGLFAFHIAHYSHCTCTIYLSTTNEVASKLFAKCEQFQGIFMFPWSFQEL